jgi:hypothetical protein
MNENNNAIKRDIAINSYKIESNHDEEGTYSVEINTSAHTIIYPKAIVTFGVNKAIAFPVGFQIEDDDDNVLFNYSLNLQQEQQDENQQANN